ncbi:unnamed protein product, partial [Acidithrix sp. C25]
VSLSDLARRVSPVRLNCFLGAFSVLADLACGFSVKGNNAG